MFQIRFFSYVYAGSPSWKGEWTAWKHRVRDAHYLYAIARSFFVFHFDFSNSIIAWRITDRGVDSWDSCGEAGPCECAYLRRAVNCWERLGGRYKAERHDVRDDEDKRLII